MMRKIIGCTFKTLMVLSITGSAVSAETIAGWVDYAEQYTLSVGTDGVVKEIAVKEGERVLAGTVLLSLSDDLLKAEIAAAQGELSLGREKMNEANRSFERDQALFDEGSLATVELDLARIRQLQQQAHVAGLKAKLAAAEQHLDMGKIVAPVAGVVLQLNVARQQRVNMHSLAKPMIRFASSAVKVNAQAPAAAGKSPALNSTVELKSAGGTARGVVRVVLIEGDMQHISISIESEQAGFQPGQSVEIVF